MGTEEAPVCLRHPGEVRMKLRTLHSDMGAPGQVVAVYTCPECGYERRVPITRGPRRSGGSDRADGFAWGAV